ncbi:glycosyltransferase family 2 protein [Marasmius fiardii PR-910]|nr:glycosyltransferase family 2 protein [Marasmius fiardii PR-910]
MNGHTAVSNGQLTKEIYLVTGGWGFIGFSVAKRLHAQGHHVRIADIAPLATSGQHLEGIEYRQGNLCDPHFCDSVMQNVHIVLHFAANMGGMGTIHEDNNFTIYSENFFMTTNVLQSAVKADVRRFLFASSACVYPDHLQKGTKDLQLRESDVHSGDDGPSPQGLYGLEKLVGEFLIQQMSSKISVRIARLHNVYGPGGTWHGGREKAPAAFARKSVAAKLLTSATGSPVSFEIWGDGTQRRSFLYVDDCVDGLVRLLERDYQKPLNIGSDHSVSILDLANMSLDAVGLDRSQVTLSYLHDKPTGVQSRNSNNELVQRELGWTPMTSLEEGMRRTVAWIESEVDQMLAAMDEGSRVDFLQELKESKMVHLASNIIKFAVLLPITSRNTDSPETCLSQLRTFAASLSSTTWRDTHSLGETTQFHVKVYLAIDNDDYFLLDGKAEEVLRLEGIVDVTRLVCDYPKGEVCSLWRHCARKAWEEGCEYMALFGDDVELLDEGWLRAIHSTFNEISKRTGGPHGVGCVAFTDVSFPGMPTFPVIHRTHMDIFDGEVVPREFVNQDGDPFLFQLYRRFGSSVMLPSFRLRNSIGGSEDARYTKHRLVGWTFDILDAAAARVESWPAKDGHRAERKLTLDVIVPSFRVQLDTLSPILELKASDTCQVMFIIIIDDPRASSIAELEHKYGHRADVRIRVNSRNLGASASRNRGMDESAAEYVFFLDDDVVPDRNILFEAEKVIRANPNAAGFVGTTRFPPADTIFKTAVHLAAVTYFWDIASKHPDNDDLPWGVTANLIARRNKDGVKYDLRFPKTGGGEDIDFCLRKRDLFVETGKKGFKAAPGVVATHPWWYDGQRTYWRFYMWAKGDGALVSMFPELCYIDSFPNSAQLFLYTGLFPVLGVITANWSLFVTGLVTFTSVFIANLCHDVYRHLLRDKTVDSRSTIGALAWMIAVAESSLIRMVSEAGRLVGQMERGEWGRIFSNQRFDWFTGRAGDGPRNNERKNNRERGILWSLFTVLFVAFVWRKTA